MITAKWFTEKNVYAVTYATVDERGIHYESELAIQRSDGKMTTLHMPTQLSERQDIQRLICQQHGR